jgi:hypothetical protein
METDIVRWARQAGFVVDEKAQQHQPNCIFHTHHMVDELLQRFAALVRADEREQCAKVCEDLRPSKPEYDQRFYDGCTLSAAEIRQRHVQQEPQK